MFGGNTKIPSNTPHTTAADEATIRSYFIFDLQVDMFNLFLYVVFGVLVILVLGILYYLMRFIYHHYTLHVRAMREHQEYMTRPPPQHSDYEVEDVHGPHAEYYSVDDTPKATLIGGSGGGDYALVPLQTDDNTLRHRVSSIQPVCTTMIGSTYVENVVPMTQANDRW